jgi:hypothetical protein
MNVGVMKDYKLRDLRASHTLGWSCSFTLFLGEIIKKKKVHQISLYYSLDTPPENKCNGEMEGALPTKDAQRQAEPGQKQLRT